MAYARRHPRSFAAVGLAGLAVLVLLAFGTRPAKAVMLPLEHYSGTDSFSFDDCGFTLDVENYSYAEGAALLRSDMSFDTFVATLSSDFVYLNIHTDAHQDGEISGRLRPQG